METGTDNALLDWLPDTSPASGGMITDKCLTPERFDELQQYARYKTNVDIGNAILNWHVGEACAMGQRTIYSNPRLCRI